MNMNVTIRPESPSDIERIYAITIEAFKEEIHSDHTEQYIVNALRRSGALTISTVAELDGTVVGHVAVSPVVISSGDKNWFGVGPISVQPDYQGMGIGSDLMQAVIKQLKAQGAAGCVLLGEPSFYTRFGFKSYAALSLSGVPAEYFQALSFGSAIPTGTVSYHKAFAAISDE